LTKHRHKNAHIILQNDNTKGLYQNDYSDQVDNSSDFMSQNTKKRKKTPSKGAKSKGYTALAKKYSVWNDF